MITIELDRKDYLVIRASGTLTKADYRAAVPELEEAMSRMRGKPRILIRLEDFHGWSMEALWEDLRFDMKHYEDFGRVAVVGESELEEWMTWFVRPFSGSMVRYFSWDQMGEAERWLSEPH